jgi:hypothetical protein
MKAGGVLTMLAIGLFLLKMFRGERKREPLLAVNQ